MCHTVTLGTNTSNSDDRKLTNTTNRRRGQFRAVSVADEALDVEATPEKEVALKFYRVKRRRQATELENERRAYEALQGLPGIPTLRWSAVEDECAIMVTDLMGPSLAHLFEACGRRFSLKTVVMLADEMLLRLRNIHGRGYIHGDVKPGNFLLARPRARHAFSSHPSHTSAAATAASGGGGGGGGAVPRWDSDAYPPHIIAVDFGFSSPYWDDAADMHVGFYVTESFRGTHRYCSLGTHLGHRHSRRDDLESLGYCLVYFLRGRLPWQGMAARTKEEKASRVFRAKSGTSVEELCAGLPPEFHQFLDYCRRLRFEQRPDYGYLRSLFSAVAEREGFSFDYQFDWTGSWVDHGSPSAAVMETHRGVTRTPGATASGARTDPGETMRNTAQDRLAWRSRSFDGGSMVSPYMRDGQLAGGHRDDACFSSLLPGESPSILSRLYHHSIGVSADGSIELRSGSEP